MNALARPSSRERRQALIAALKEAGAIDDGILSRAELVAARTSQPVEQVLNQMGGLSDEALAQAYATHSSFPLWTPTTEPPVLNLAGLGVTSDYLQKSRIMVVGVTPSTLICAVTDPFNDDALSGLRFATGRQIELRVARQSDWRSAFEQIYSREPTKPVALDERRLEREIDLVSDNVGDGPGARLVASIFEAAIAAGASDIHFEPRRHDLCIRLRVDGRMVAQQIAPADLAQPCVSRIKVIANLDLGERRLPQDGRTTFVIGGKSVDVRVATSPTVFGESAVLRILDRTAVPLDLDALSLNRGVVSILRRAASAPHGLFLVTGPTGSGKTTTLYALLQSFSGSAKKVLSVEDPVEYHFEHVSQTQVAPSVGLTFASALRSFLRQDPDVILVGEIRDPETASVAVQAAMTGHLVLASIHANDALGVVPRLQDMGVEPFQLAAGFRGAVAQRLVRRLCPDCTTKRPAEAADLSFAKSVGAEAAETIAEPVGCPKCKGSGYRGRITIAEGFSASEEFLRTVANPAVGEDLARVAARCGLASMASDGYRQIQAGLTTKEEVASAIYG